MAPVVLRRYAVCVTERAAEVSGLGVAPAGGDQVDGSSVQRRVGQVAAGVFETLTPDPAGNCESMLLEEAVQVAGGDVVCGGDGRRRQLRIMQAPLDEGTDAQYEGLSVGFRGRDLSASRAWANSAESRSTATVPSRGPSSGR